MREIKVPKSAIVGIFSLVIIVAMLFLFQGAFEDCDKSKIYVNQYPFTGRYAVWTEGGLQKQFCGKPYDEKEVEEKKEGEV